MSVTYCALCSGCIISNRAEMLDKLLDANFCYCSVVKRKTLLDITELC